MPNDTSNAGHLGVLLRLLNQQFASAVDDALSEAGFGDVRSTHASVFTFVPPEGMSVSELTRLARLRKQSMTQTVEDLERLGYVERRPDPSDGRARLVFLTAKGRKIRPLASAAGARIEAQWARLVGAGRVSELKATLSELLAQLVPPPEPVPGEGAAAAPARAGKGARSASAPVPAASRRPLPGRAAKARR